MLGAVRELALNHRSVPPHRDHGHSSPTVVCGIARLVSRHVRERRVGYQDGDARLWVPHDSRALALRLVPSKDPPHAVRGQVLSHVRIQGRAVAPHQEAVRHHVAAGQAGHHEGLPTSPALSSHFLVFLKVGVCLEEPQLPHLPAVQLRSPVLQRRGLWQPERRRLALQRAVAAVLRREEQQPTAQNRAVDEDAIANQEHDLGHAEVLQRPRLKGLRIHELRKTPEQVLVVRRTAKHLELHTPCGQECIGAQGLLHEPLEARKGRPLQLSLPKILGELLLHPLPAHGVEVADGIDVGQLTFSKLGRQAELVGVAVADEEENPLRLLPLQADQGARHADVSRPLVWRVPAEHQVPLVCQGQQGRVILPPAQDCRPLHQGA
mmetsp:Transcript_92260/g.270023  ORF Transcript_92260/g.270023 Transcript_92260/m.270023 type:complete len:379 (-) Transcript_92260:66-1202(-)